MPTRVVRSRSPERVNHAFWETSPGFFSQIHLQSLMSVPRREWRNRSWVWECYLHRNIKKRERHVSLRTNTSKWTLLTSGKHPHRIQRQKKGIFTGRLSFFKDEQTCHRTSLFPYTCQSSSQTEARLRFYLTSNSKRRRRKKLEGRKSVFFISWIGSEIRFFCFPISYSTGGSYPEGRRVTIPPATDCQLTVHHCHYTSRVPGDLLTELITPPEDSRSRAFSLILSWLPIFPEGLNSKTTKKSTHKGRK